METRITSPEHILQKLLDTVDAYRPRYPELGYIRRGINQFESHTGDSELVLLEFINLYLKEKLFEYYVIRNIQYKFQKDLEGLKVGSQPDNSVPLYLEFAGAKEMTPIK